jgi:hypothetical protein
LGVGSDTSTRKYLLGAGIEEGDMLKGGLI